MRNTAWRRKLGIPAYRAAGGAILFKAGELDAWLVGRREQPDPGHMLIGDSTRARKTSSVGLGLDILDRAVPDCRLAEQASPESFVEQLASRSKNSSLWSVDEMGEMLDKLHHTKYMAGRLQRAAPLALRRTRLSLQTDDEAHQEGRARRGRLRRREPEPHGAQHDDAKHLRDRHSPRRQLGVHGPIRRHHAGESPTPTSA